MKNRPHLVLKLLIIAGMTLAIHDVTGQDLYSKGIGDRGSALGFLELKVIDTDPILKMAKETAPFDRPFFLKIKRPSVGEPQAAVGVRTITTDTLKTSIDDVDSTVIVKHSIVRKKEEKIPGKEQAKGPSVIKSIILKGNSNYSSGKLTPKPIDIQIYPNGSVYQETKKSEHVFIELQNLKPGHGYEIIIAWAKDSVINEESYYFTTVASSLIKRAEQRLSAQIGVAGAFFENESDISIEPSLMLGVYYNLRPVDKDIPLQSYKAWAPQRFSVLFGLTINSIAEDHLRGDLLGSNNILLGLGYQPVDAVRISYGAIFFNEIDPNRLLSENKSIATTPYFAVTLDLNIQDLLGGVVTTLGFK